MQLNVSNKTTHKWLSRVHCLDSLCCNLAVVDTSCPTGAQLDSCLRKWGAVGTGLPIGPQAILIESVPDSWRSFRAVISQKCDWIMSASLFFISSLFPVISYNRLFSEIHIHMGTFFINKLHLWQEKIIKEPSPGIPSVAHQPTSTTYILIHGRGLGSVAWWDDSNINWYSINILNVSLVLAFENLSLQLNFDFGILPWQTCSEPATSRAKACAPSVYLLSQD